MHSYSIYYRKDQPLDDSGLIVVPEKFHWIAFFLPLIWALWHRLWLVACCYGLFILLLQVISELYDIDSRIVIVAVIGAGLIIASAAPFLKGWQYRKEGYRELSPVLAKSVRDAENVILADLLDAGWHQIRQKDNPSEREEKSDRDDDNNY
ncbi:MAG: DUF2628 domain-containing protein [Sneathiella sp.]